MQYLLDTNICIYAMRRAPIEVFKRLAGLRSGDVAMSVITLAELLAARVRDAVPQPTGE